MLEQQLTASVQQEAAAIQQQRDVAERLRTQPVSRRRAIRLVAIGSAGLGLVGIGLEGLHAFESALLGQDVTQSALSS
jgi:hypothetical protein